MQRRHLAFALPGLCLALNARAQVQLGGVMGQKALLVINGQTEVVAVGASARGVRLVSLQGDTAQVEVSGQLSTLRVGGSPVALGGGISGRKDGPLVPSPTQPPSPSATESIPKTVQAVRRTDEDARERIGRAQSVELIVGAYQPTPSMC